MWRSSRSKRKLNVFKMLTMVRKFQSCLQPGSWKNVFCDHKKQQNWSEMKNTVNLFMIQWTVRSQVEWKKRSERRARRDAKTARWLQWAKKFRPAADPLPGDAGRPKFNRLEIVTNSTYRHNAVWWRSMHAIASYRGNRPTNKPTHKHTHTQTDRTDNNTLRR